MNDKVNSQGSDHVSELAAFLQRVAGGVGGRHGDRNWDGLVQVVTGYSTDPGEQVAGMPALADLQKAPDDANAAEVLARTLLDLAHADPAVSQRLGAWRGQGHIRLLETSARHASQQAPDQPLVTAAPQHGRANADPAPAPSPPAPVEPADPGRKLSELLQIQNPMAVLSLGAAFLALRWPLFQVASVLTLVVAGTALWYRRKQGRPWRDRSVTLTSSLCVIAAIVLATAFWRGPANPLSGNPRPSVSQPGGAGSSPAAAAPPETGSSSPAPGHGTPPAQGSAVLATAHNSPARIEAMTIIKPLTGNSWVTAKPLRLTSQQLAQVNRVSAGESPLPAALDPVPLDDAVSDITFVGNASGVVTINGIAVAKQ
jgi:hypothetical protein